MGFFFLSEDFNQWAIRIACVRINLFLSKFLLSFPNNKKKSSKFHRIHSSQDILFSVHMSSTGLLSQSICRYFILLSCVLSPFLLFWLGQRMEYYFEATVWFLRYLIQFHLNFVSFFYGCCIIHCHVEFFIYFHCILCQIQSAPHIGSDHKKKHKTKQNEWRKEEEEKMKWWTQSKL